MLVCLCASLRAGQKDGATEAVRLEVLHDFAHFGHEVDGFARVDHLSFRENELRLYLSISVQNTLRLISSSKRIVANKCLTWAPMSGAVLE